MSNDVKFFETPCIANVVLDAINFEQKNCLCLVICVLHIKVPTLGAFSFYCQIK